MAPSAMRRLLVIRTDAIGDMICTTPLLHLLHRHFPQTQIWVAASDRNADVIASDPAVARVVTLVEKGKIRRAGISELRSSSFDIVLQCVTNSTTKYGLISRFVAPHAVIAGLAHRERPEYEGLYTTLVDVPDLYSRHYVDIMLEFARQEFHLDIAARDRSPRIVVEPAVEESADRFFAEHHLRRGEPVLVNCSAAQPSKRWPHEQYHALLALLTAQGKSVLLSSVEADQPLVDALRARHDSVPIHAPTIRHLASISERCAMIITPDTAVVHVASATGTPVVALYADLNNVVAQWLPYHVPFRAVRSPSAHVESITATQVVDAMNDLEQEIQHTSSPRNGNI